MERCVMSVTKAGGTLPDEPGAPVHAAYVRDRSAAPLPVVRACLGSMRSARQAGLEAGDEDARRGMQTLFCYLGIRDGSNSRCSATHSHTSCRSPFLQRLRVLKHFLADQ